MTPAARRVTLVLLTTIYGMGFIDRIVIALVAQQIKTEFLVSDLQIGLLSGTAFALVNTLAGLPLARLAEHRARKWVACVALLVTSAFTAFTGSATSFVQLLAMRLGMAAGSAGTEAPPHSMISDMYPAEKRASAMSLFLLGVPIAALVGSFVGGGIAQSHGWRMAFLSLGLLGALVAVVAMFATREPERGAQEQPSAQLVEMRGVYSVLVEILKQPNLRQILIGIGVISLGGFGVNTFLPAFFARNFGLGPASTGLVYGLVSSAASATGTILGGFTAERLAKRNPKWLLVAPGLGPFIGVPLFLAGVTQHNLYMALPLMLVGSISFYMALGPAIAALHGELDARSRATGSALLLLVMYTVGQGFGPPAAGFASDLFSSWVYGAGDFAHACAGVAGQAPGSPCANAAAAGLKYAIAAFGVFYVWSGVHFLLAGFARDKRVNPR